MNCTADSRQEIARRELLHRANGTHPPKRRQSSKTRTKMAALLRQCSTTPHRRGTREKPLRQTTGRCRNVRGNDRRMHTAHHGAPMQQGRSERIRKRKNRIGNEEGGRERRKHLIPRVGGERNMNSRLLLPRDGHALHHATTGPTSAQRVCSINLRHFLLCWCPGALRTQQLQIW